MFDPLRSKLRVMLFSGLVFTFGLATASTLGWTRNSVAMPILSDQPVIEESRVQPALDLSDAFVAIAETVTPAVVRIETSRTRQAASRGGAPAPQVPEEFRQFFRMPDPRQQEPVRAGGSGFLVSADGYILTNDHVVAGAEEIRVFLQDRREFRATLIGADPTTDVAVIRIEGEQLPSLSFGSSDRVRVGEWVVAIGNPGFGSGNQLDYTVTAGIVSAKGRPLGLINQELRMRGNENFQFAIEDFIQTDAVINPGNSGGPLVDLRGQVVGINSAIASETGFYQGYGFAIPVDLARRVMEDLIEYGVVRRPWLGVQILDITPEDAEVYGLPEVSGVLVQGFGESGGQTPAQRAGIQPEDVIVAIDGRPVGRVGGLQQTVAQRRPGERVRVQLYRGGQPREVTVELGEAPIAAAPQRAAATPVSAEDRLGITVVPMTPELAQRYGFAEAEGVVVEAVRSGGVIARRGLTGPGWKIVEINRQTVRTVDDVRGLLSGVTAGDVVSLRIAFGNGSTQVYNVRIPPN
jgi:serine protease Do